MIWVLLWAVLVLAATALLGLLGLRLWRQFRSLVSELGAATDRLGGVADRLAVGAQSPNAGHLDRPAVRSPVSRQRH